MSNMLAEEVFFWVIDRFTRDEVYRNRMTANGVSFDIMQEWDETFANRKVPPLPVYAVPHNIRKREYPRWEYRPAMVGGSDTVPNVWDYPELSISMVARPRVPRSSCDCSLAIEMLGFSGMHMRGRAKFWVRVHFVSAMWATSP